LIINVAGMDAGDVGIMLDVDFNIATRTGLHCAPLVHQQLGIDKIHGGVRFGIGPFNTEVDIDAAVVAMTEIAGRARKAKKKSAVGQDDH
jgi:selenocysteine lyase/cysteine desulfurase